MNINHVLIQTSDLRVMTQFIENVIGLKSGHRPPFPFAGAWMYHQHKPVVHIVEAAPNSAQKEYLGGRELSAAGAVDHVAFEGDNYEDLIARLVNQNIDYFERTVPLSKEHQVFINGPDGVKLEILFKQDKSPLNFS